MEPKFLLSSPRTSQPFAASPLFLNLSYKLNMHTKSYLHISNNLSFSGKLFEESQFLGKRVNLHEKSSYSNFVRFCPVAAIVKRRKEVPFDNVIDRDKRLKFVLKIRKILVNQQGRVMPLSDLGRYRKQLGIQKKSRFIALLRKFPAVFEIHETGVYSLDFKLTPEAEKLYLEEIEIRNEMEDLLVIKLKKLLMMSLDKQILLKKIVHLRTDFGLPLDFTDTVCHKYPQHFRVVSTVKGPALKLTNWDQELAVSNAELEQVEEPSKVDRMKLSKAPNLSRGEIKYLSEFNEMPYISPYVDFSKLRSGSAEKEKHACGVIHEILSLTVEKKILIDSLTHFRDEYRFSQQLRGMLIRHPDMFYVSLKGERDSVFLREGYRDSELVVKDKLLFVKEKLRDLVLVPQIRGRKSGEDSDDDDGSNDDNDDDFGDEYDDDEVPPDFDEDDGILNMRPIKELKKNDSNVIVSSSPDVRQRECW